MALNVHPRIYSTVFDGANKPNWFYLTNLAADVERVTRLEGWQRIQETLQNLLCRWESRVVRKCQTSVGLDRREPGV